MKTLADARAWYLSAQTQLGLMKRLADRHWPALAPVDTLWQDDAFRTLEAERVLLDSKQAIDPIADLAVVVLFSVFEAIVRDHVAEAVRDEMGGIRHGVLRDAAETALEGVEVGSFNRILEAFKRSDTVNLIEQVNQVRRYRNWVAHGKSESKRKSTEAITPEMAYDRLSAFLARFLPAAV
jgi:hypothetical protein